MNYKQELHSVSCLFVFYSIISTLDNWTSILPFFPLEISPYSLHSFRDVPLTGSTLHVTLFTHSPASVVQLVRTLSTIREVMSSSPD